MATITRDGKYDDIVELELYNGIASGINEKGDAFFYVNPMEVWPENCLAKTSKEHIKPFRQGWFPCACCPPNLSRTYANLAAYIYHEDANTQTIYIRQYIANQASFRQGETEIRVEGNYAKDGQVTIQVNKQEEQKIAVRIPSWTKTVDILVNGKSQHVAADNSYVICELAPGENRIQLDFHITPKFIITKAAVRDNRGLVAVRRGPVIYCVEEVDNGSHLASLVINTNEGLGYEEDIPLKVF